MLNITKTDRTEHGKKSRRKVFVVTSGRADSWPLTTVISEVEKLCDVEVMDVCATPPDIVLQHVQRRIKGSDVLLILGDRQEIAAAALAATIERVPIAHIHGGEVTAGSFDNQLRNAITKLSHLHFASTKIAAQNIVLMAEIRERVFVVGAPGLENLPKDLPYRKERFFLITWHSATLRDPTEGLQEMIDVIKGDFSDYGYIWTSPGNDPGKDEILKLLKKNNITITKMTPEEYVAAMSIATAVVGNSSSGIIEAPSVKTPTVNIGYRQFGRIYGPSVFSAEPEKAEILECFYDAVGYSGSFSNPYRGQRTSRRIAQLIATHPLEIEKW